MLICSSMPYAMFKFPPDCFLQHLSLHELIYTELPVGSMDPRALHSLSLALDSSLSLLNLLKETQPSALKGGKHNSFLSPNRELCFH